MDNEIKELKYNIFKICWYMRGGISANDLFHTYTHEDREILNTLIKENIETTNKTGLPLL